MQIQFSQNHFAGSYQSSGCHVEALASGFFYVSGREPPCPRPKGGGVSLCVRFIADRRMYRNIKVLQMSSLISAQLKAASAILRRRKNLAKVSGGAITGMCQGMGGDECLQVFSSML